MITAITASLVLPQESGARPATTTPLANWHYRWSIDSKKELKKLAKWDVVILDIENEHYNRKRVRRLKELNPDIIVLAYISMVDIRADSASLDKGTARREIGEMLSQHPEWVLRQANGTPVEWWPSFTMMNISTHAPKKNGKRFHERYQEFIRDEVVKDSLWDGVFFDNVWGRIQFVGRVDLDQDGKTDAKKTADRAWRKGVRKILKATRADAKKHRKKFIVAGNGGVNRYADLLDGIGFEHFPHTKYGRWKKSMQQYRAAQENGIEHVFINTNVRNSGNKKQYRKMRFGLASTLLHDGFYSFDDGDKTHGQLWWYDEYDINLGKPISVAQNILKPDDPHTIQRGIWVRDYEHVRVVVNSTDGKKTFLLPGGMFQSIAGDQAPRINSGTHVSTLTLEAHDGIILKKIST